MAKSTLSEKITLLNQAVLESLNYPNEREIIRRFVETGTKVLNADFGYSFLRESTGKKFDLAYITPGIPYKPIAKPRKYGIVNRAFATKKPQLISDVNQIGYIRYDAKSAMKSVAVIPMTYKNKSYGTLHFAYNKTRRFTKEDLSVCSFLGNSAAQAITISRLYSNLQDFQQTLDKTLDSIFLFDPGTFKISYLNTGALKQLGWNRRQLTRNSILDILDTASRSLLKGEIEYVIKGKNHSSLFEIVFLTRTGKKITTEMLLQYVPYSGQSAQLLGIVRDISERKKTEEKIKHAAFHDALTGLPNRMLFTQQLTAQLAEASRERKKFALLFMDLDRFKFINDILGHVVGDELLRDAASRLRNSIKKNDLVSRLGGDEFVILLRNLRSAKDTDRVAKRIIEAFQTPFKLGGQEIYVNISIGISNYPQDGRDAIRLLKNADNALYRVKQEGGNNFQHYHQGIIIPEVERLELDKQLRKALRTDELRLYYQPIFNLRTGRLVSVEALVRWQHPEMGLIFPNDFISQAEDSGLIVPLGGWIFEQACQQARQWLKKGYRVPISVNVSPRQLLQQDLIPQVRRLLRRYKLPPDLLEVELTENFLIQNMDVSIDILQQFRDLGLKIYIDDFGTGYASLNYLKRLPIDYIKIDRSFTQGLSDSQDAGLVKAIISMSHHLKLNVVAEGVESPAQAEFLASTKCDLVQGNFYSEAVPEDKLTSLLRKAKL